MSRSFVFRLDAALQQRERQEQAAQVVLAEARRNLGAEVAELERMRQALAQERRHSVTMGEGLHLEGRLNLLYYLDRAGQRIQRQQQLVQQREQDVLRVQALFTQAAARRHALEKLRDRRRREFYMQDQRRADQANDEQVTQRYTIQADHGRDSDARHYGT